MKLAQLSLGLVACEHHTNKMRGNWEERAAASADAQAAFEVGVDGEAEAGGVPPQLLVPLPRDGPRPRTAPRHVSNRRSATRLLLGAKKKLIASAPKN